MRRSLPLLFCCLPLLVAAVVVRPLDLPDLPGLPGLSASTAPGPAPDPAASLPLTDGFDFPVGAPDAAGYVDAQPFGRNDHLGADWNARTGGNSDLGDPVHAAAAGRVIFAGEGGPGWGPVVRVLHRTPAGPVETLYAHLDEIQVASGALLQRGQQLGTIGTAHGRYLAHLHFELRDVVGMELGPGYAADRDGWVDPTAYILANRPAGAR